MISVSAAVWYHFITDTDQEHIGLHAAVPFPPLAYILRHRLRDAHK